MRIDNDGNLTVARAKTININMTINGNLYLKTMFGIAVLRMYVESIMKIHVL